MVEACDPNCLCEACIMKTVMTPSSIQNIATKLMNTLPDMKIEDVLENPVAKEGGAQEFKKIFDYTKLKIPENMDINSVKSAFKNGDEEAFNEKFKKGISGMLTEENIEIFTKEVMYDEEKLNKILSLFPAGSDFVQNFLGQKKSSDP